MAEYNITKNTIDNFVFYSRGAYDFYDSNRTCDYCGNIKLSKGYVKIIRQLIKTELIPHNYRYICCRCFKMENKKPLHCTECGLEKTVMFGLGFYYCPICDNITAFQ